MVHADQVCRLPARQSEPSNTASPINLLENSDNVVYKLGAFLEVIMSDAVFVFTVSPPNSS